MNEKEQVQRQIQTVLGEMQYLTRLLYVVRDPSARNLALQQLWSQISYLSFLVGLLDRGPAALGTGAGAAAQQTRTFTREELAAATGRNGNPAYVAVNGVVYDVTNHKGWSNATHFGLQAGRDLTAEFATCHAAQQWILATLRPVGRLA